MDKNTQLHQIASSFASDKRNLFVYNKLAVNILAWDHVVFCIIFGCRTRIVFVVALFIMFVNDVAVSQQISQHSELYCYFVWIVSSLVEWNKPGIRMKTQNY